MQRLRSLYWLRGWCSRFEAHLSAVLVAVSLFTLLLTARQLSWLQPLELSTFDHLVRLQDHAQPHPKLLIVGISEADIKALQQWPLKDELLAQALGNLRKHGAALVGLNIYRGFPHEPGHVELLEELRTGNVIAIAKLGIPAESNIPAPPSVPPVRVGFSDIPLDADGVKRRTMLYAKVQDRVYASFAMQLALHYLRQQGITPQDAPTGFVFGASLFTPLTPQSGGYRGINAGGFQMLLNYRRYPLPAEVVNFRGILEGRVSADKIRGRIVLIGVTAPSIKDEHFTPFSSIAKIQVKTPGILIHAHILSQILDAVETRGGFRFWPQWAELSWLLLWGAIAALLTWRIRRLLLLQAVALVGLGILVGIHWLLFQQSVWVPVWEAGLAFFAGALSILAGRQVYAAFHDPLTGLPNRSNLRQRLLHWRRFRRATALILVELNRYKLINVVFGPQAGDAFLVEMAERLQAVSDEYRNLRISCGYDNFLARTSDAEFALLLMQAPNKDAIRKLAEAIQKRCAKPFIREGEKVFLTTTVGIAFGNQNYHGNLLRDAHAALSHANALRNALEIFDGAVKAKEVEDFQMERELHAAVSENQPNSPHLPEFLVYYQPLVDLRKGRISGFEALVRWQNPQRGFISPGEFVPIAENSGTIVPIGNWVLLEACRQMRTWQAEFPDLLISVNLAAPQLVDPDTPAYLEWVLKETGLSPTSLKLELTESAAIQHLDIALKLLDACHALGIRLAIDDFGTGYSSLAYLTQFPVDTLKIDMAFVRNMDASAHHYSILRIITELAQDLNLATIAEGVETTHHLETLRKLGCDYGQGYLFGKPLPAAETEALLHAEKRGCGVCLT